MSSRLPKPPKPVLRWQVYASVNPVTGVWEHVKVGPTGPVDDRMRHIRVQVGGRAAAEWVAEFDHVPTTAEIAALEPTLPAAVGA